MEEPLRGPTNGGSNVSVREWANARASDRRELEHHAEFAALAAEERLMKIISDHMTSSREAHKAQDDRATKLGDGLDGIKSIIDQQRGAKNLIVIFGAGTVLNIALNVITILARHP